MEFKISQIRADARINLLKHIQLNGVVEKGGGFVGEFHHCDIRIEQSKPDKFHSRLWNKYVLLSQEGEFLLFPSIARQLLVWRQQVVGTFSIRVTWDGKSFVQIGTKKFSDAVFTLI